MKICQPLPIISVTKCPFLQSLSTDYFCVRNGSLWTMCWRKKLIQTSFHLHRRRSTAWRRLRQRGRLGWRRGAWRAVAPCAEFARSSWAVELKWRRTWRRMRNLCRSSVENVTFGSSCTLSWSLTTRWPTRWPKMRAVGTSANCARLLSRNW